MANSQRLDKEKDKITERILNLTLEILYLLTGENYIAFKLSDGLAASNLMKTQSPVIEPPSRSLRQNNKKVKEVTSEIIKLLTGEVPIKFQDVTVYFSTEELGVSRRTQGSVRERHDGEPATLTSPDGSSNRNTPERCPCPLYSQDSTQEHQKIPQDSWDSTQETHSIPEDDQVDAVEDLSDNMNQNDPNLTEYVKDEDVILIKVKDLHEEEMRDGETCEEEIPPEISTDCRYTRHTKKKRPFIASDGLIEDNGAAEDYTVVTPTSQNLCQGRQHANESYSPFMYTGSLSVPLTHHVPEGGEEAFLCFECGKCFSKQSSLERHRQLMHIWEKPHSCSECGKCFGHKISLVRHQRIHKNEDTFLCPLCGRCFAQKSHLVEHERQHTGEKPYVCMECGKRFAVKRSLVSHVLTHGSQKQFCCPECGKCFTQRNDLFSHQRVHLSHTKV